MSKVSVIIPAYNGEGFIKETLDCILRQSLQDTEVIVVNDGSTDNTAFIVGKYSRKHKNIRLITQKNAGVSAARNNGLEQATGEYVVFLDCDDYYTDNSLEAFYNTAVATGADCVMGRLRYFDENGLGEYHLYSDMLAKKEKIDNFDRLLLWNFLPANKFYKREALINSGVRFAPITFCEDGAFFMSFVYTGATLAGCPESCFCYRRHSVSQGLSVSQKASLKGAADMMTALEIIYKNACTALESKGTDEKEEYLQEILFKNAHILVSQFYRLMWTCDEECYAFIVSSLEKLKSMMSRERFSALCDGNPDLELNNLHKSRAGFCEKAEVKIILKPKGNKNYKPMLDSVYGQSCPDFCLAVPETFYKKMPEKYRLPNVIVLSDRGFVRKARGAVKSSYTLKIKNPKPLDTRIIRFVIGERIIPKLIKKRAFSTVVFAVGQLLKIKKGE